MQVDITQHNQKAWNLGAYEAWTRRYGNPQIAAQKILQAPQKQLGSLNHYIENVNGKKVANLLGSHGRKAVALALLGADVTIVDFSEENKRYAVELADAAGIQLDYHVADVIQAPDTLFNQYDYVISEFGILHYFLDLGPYFQIVYQLLKPGGIFLIQDFHPISTKLISSRGTTAKIRKHKVTGDYFDTSIEEVDVSYAKYLPPDIQQDIPKTRLRKWTLGEIVTSIATENLMIQVLHEEPNLSSEVFDKGIPKTFTIKAMKHVTG